MEQRWVLLLLLLIGLGLSQISSAAEEEVSDEKSPPCVIVSIDGEEGILAEDDEERRIRQQARWAEIQSRFAQQRARLLARSDQRDSPQLSCWARVRSSGKKLLGLCRRKTLEILSSLDVANSIVALCTYRFGVKDVAWESSDGEVPLCVKRGVCVEEDIDQTKHALSLISSYPIWQMTSFLLLRAPERALWRSLGRPSHSMRFFVKAAGYSAFKTAIVILPTILNSYMHKVISSEFNHYESLQDRGLLTEDIFESWVKKSYRGVVIYGMTRGLLEFLGTWVHAEDLG